MRKRKTPGLPAARVDVARGEHESLCRQVEENRIAIQRVERELAALRRLIENRDKRSA